jgi:hypothetical protein
MSVAEKVYRGISAATMIQHMLDQREANARHQWQQERENSVRDIQTRMLLNSNARPVQGGGVADTFSPGRIAESAGMNRATMPGDMAVTRSAAPGRVVDYGGQQYELLSPEDKARMAMDQLRQSTELKEGIETRGATARTRAEITAKAEAAAAQRGALARTFNLPGLGEIPLMPVEFGGAASLLAQVSPLPEVGVTSNYATGMATGHRIDRRTGSIQKTGEIPNAVGRAPRQTAGGSAPKADKPPKPSRSEVDDDLTAKVLQDSAAGGGSKVDEALKNLDQHYGQDARFTPGAKLRIRARLNKIKEDGGGANPFAGQRPPAAPAPTGTPTTVQAAPADMVPVQLPDGRTGRIPKAKLADALKAGAKAL